MSVPMMDRANDFGEAGSYCLNGSGRFYRTRVQKRDFLAIRIGSRVRSGSIWRRRPPRHEVLFVSSSDTQSVPRNSSSDGPL